MAVRVGEVADLVDAEQGGRRVVAQPLPARAGIYERRNDQVTLDQWISVVRIVL